MEEPTENEDQDTESSGAQGTLLPQETRNYTGSGSLPTSAVTDEMLTLQSIAPPCLGKK